MQFTTATLAILLLAFAAVVRANSYSPSGCSRALITKMDEQSNTHLWTCTDYHREDCFDAATLVWRRNGTSLPMRDLSVGDEILDAKGRPTKVTDFTTNRLAYTAVLDLFDNNNAHLLTLTPKHVLHMADDTEKYADEVREGDYVDSYEQAAYVYRVERRVSDVHVITPMTEAGSLTVGQRRVAASCYAHTKWTGALHAYTRARTWLRPYGGRTSWTERKLTAGARLLGLAH